MATQHSTPFYTLDIGNRNPHVGFFHAGHLHHVFPLKEFTSDKEKLGPKLEGEEEIPLLCSKVGPDFSLPFNLKKSIKTFSHLRGERNFLDMPVNYAVTLGEDRLYQAYYLYKVQKMPTWLVDIGTFATIDLISADGFQGGFILPGPEVYLESYHKGSLLPRLEFNQKTFYGRANHLPHTTEDAMRLSLPMIWEAISDWMKKKHPKVENIFLTGGKVDYLNLRNISDFNVMKDAHLIHHALAFLWNQVGERQ